LRCPVDQPDLQRAGLAGGNEAGGADHATGTTVTADRHTHAGNREAAADLNRNLRDAGCRGRRAGRTFSGKLK
jgi:hypothetical protein